MLVSIVATVKNNTATMSNSTSSSDDSIPFYLMPLGAVFGTYFIISVIITLNILYRNATHKPNRLSSAVAPPTSVKSGKFAFIVVTMVLSVFGYTQIVAQVETLNHVMSPFNPYEILDLPEGTSDLSLIKSTYRSLSKVHHPDKGGDKTKFQNINVAYKTLTDETSRGNWEEYGHPDGPQRFSMDMALPDWLLRPKGSVAIVMLMMYAGLFVSIIMSVIGYMKKTTKEKFDLEMQNSVAKDDVTYLLSRLNKDTSHFDALVLLATSPENVKMSEKGLQKIDQMKKEKIEMLAQEKVKNVMDLSGDWGDDNDDEQDEVARAKIEAAKKEELEQLRHRVALAQATGTVDLKLIKLEDVDDGVLGQKWVLNVLKETGSWPPKDVSPDLFKSDAATKNLVMLLGRLNSQVLNNHPQLTNASQKQLLDSIYFRNTVEFRQRTGLLLEAALRIATTTRSYPLAKTLIEAVTMFKIGCPDNSKFVWFHDIIKKQYGVIPSLIIEDKEIVTDGEDEVATGDTAALKLTMERVHAEGFTKGKILQAQKQNIPPTVALNSFQEGWWVLVRAEKIKELDGTDLKTSQAKHVPKVEMPEGMKLSPEKLAEYHTGYEKDVLLACQPTIVSNVAQKKGKIKVLFKTPLEPGKYKFYVDVKSQEFLGCDQTLTMELDILDVEDVKRRQKEEEEKQDQEDQEGNQEDKKDK